MIRKFEKRDLRDILEIERNAFPKSSYDTSTFLYLCAAYPDLFLVYEEQKVIGYVISDSTGHIISIAVHPHHRRKGVGTKLIKETLKKTRRARVEVRASNKVAQAFYRKLGFVETGIIPLYYGDEDALVMIIEEHVTYVANRKFYL